MAYTIADAPLTWRHIRIVAVASLGQLIGTGLATLVSVIIPLYQIISHPELSSAMQGLVGAMNLIGIMVGSAVLGRISDRIGYLLLFRLCPLLILLSSVAALIFPHISVLIVALFFMGFGIGGEYSLDSDYISELMPDRWRFTMVGTAKAASALGNIIVALVCFLIVKDWTDAAEWPRLLWIMVVLSSLMLIARIRFWQSPVWLRDKGMTSEARSALDSFLGPDVELPSSSETDRNGNPRAGNPPDSPAPSTLSFIRQNWKNVVFTGVPWACEGLGVYGIGVFLPILVMALGLETAAPHEAAIAHVASSVEITLWISCIILPGFVFGLFLIPKMNGVSQQTMGFVMSALSLLLLLFAYRGGWPHWISILAFMMFELFLNIGPHLMTYVLPSKVFPVEIRGMGSGIAASIGKLGAVIGVFFIPILLKSGGSSLVLIVSIVVMAAGAAVTWLFAPTRCPSRQNSAQTPE